MQPPALELFTLSMAAEQRAADVFARRREHLERQGYVFVGRGKISVNAPCPCKSGMKLKRCCISRVVRAGGGMFVKGKLDTTGLQP